MVALIGFAVGVIAYLWFASLASKYGTWREIRSHAWLEAWELLVAVEHTGLESVNVFWRLIRRTLYRLTRRKHLAMVGGLLIIYGAGIMLENKPDFVPHVTWELLAYSIHGIGLAPWLKPLERYL